MWEHLLKKRTKKYSANKAQVKIFGYSADKKRCIFFNCKNGVQQDGTPCGGWPHHKKSKSKSKRPEGNFLFNFINFKIRFLKNCSQKVHESAHLSPTVRDKPQKEEFQQQNFFLCNLPQKKCAQKFEQNWKLWQFGMGTICVHLICTQKGAKLWEVVYNSHYTYSFSTTAKPTSQLMGNCPPHPLFSLSSSVLKHLANAVVMLLYRFAASTVSTRVSHRLGVVCRVGPRQFPLSFSSWRPFRPVNYVKLCLQALGSSALVVDFVPSFSLTRYLLLPFATFCFFCCFLSSLCAYTLCAWRQWLVMALPTCSSARIINTPPY